MKIIIILVALLILFNDLLPLRKNKSKRELILLSSLAVISISLAFLFAFDVSLPSPLTAVDKLVIKIFKLKL